MANVWALPESPLRMVQRGPPQSLPPSPRCFTRRHTFATKQRPVCHHAFVTAAQLMTSTPLNRAKSFTFTVTSVNALTKAIAAIWPST